MTEQAKAAKPRAEPSPGPWTACRSQLNDLWTVYAPGHKNIAAVLDPFGNDDAVSEANARMMAAALDMFAALKDITRILEAVRYTAGIGEKQMERIEKARAAIAKAES